MEYIIDTYTENNSGQAEETIQTRAARIAGLNIVSYHFHTKVYNDFGLNSVQREFKKAMTRLIEDHESSGIYSNYKYTAEYIQEVKKYIKSIKPNSKKVKG